MLRTELTSCLAFMGIILASCALFGAEAAQPQSDGSDNAEHLSESMELPRYDKHGALLRPVDYDDWTFVGASLGLRYEVNDEHHGEGPGLFLNVFMQPEAFREYARTGYFPDKTMFVMEVYKPKAKSSIARGGYFEDEFLGIEMAVKDYDRADLGWSYYNFITPQGFVESAKPLPQAMCWDCHAENGDDDNVFTQFYPTILRARERQRPTNPQATR